MRAGDNIRISDVRLQRPLPSVLPAPPYDKEDLLTDKLVSEVSNIVALMPCAKVNIESRTLFVFPLSYTDPSRPYGNKQALAPLFFLVTYVIALHIILIIPR